LNTSQFSLDEIAQIHSLNISKNPMGTDKCFPKKYTSLVYEDIFKNFREKRIKVLEIGVRTGASLKLMVEYSNSWEITGIDISDKDFVSQFIEDPRIKITMGNAYSRQISDSIQEKFDFIIDDGPHSLSSQVYTVKNYLEKLTPGGFLFVEDIIGGKPYIFQILECVPRNFSAKIYDLRDITKVNDSIVIAIHRKNQGENYFEDTEKWRKFIRVRVRTYRLLGWLGLKRFKLN